MLPPPCRPILKAKRMSVCSTRQNGRLLPKRNSRLPASRTLHGVWHGSLHILTHFPNITDPSLNLPCLANEASPPRALRPVPAWPPRQINNNNNRPANSSNSNRRGRLRLLLHRLGNLADQLVQYIHKLLASGAFNSRLPIFTTPLTSRASGYVNFASMKASSVILPRLLSDNTK